MSGLLHKAEDALHKVGVALRLDNPDERDHAKGSHQKTHEEMEREANAEASTTAQSIEQHTPGSAAYRNLHSTTAYAPETGGEKPVHGLSHIPQMHQPAETSVRPQDPDQELELSEDRGTAGDDRAI